MGIFPFKRSSRREHHRKADPDSVAVELSSRRTGMAFQRTRLSAERTLMAVIRTSLSLISFGFAIFQFFHKLVEAKMLAGGGSAIRNFAISLVLLGVAMLMSGIGFHLAFMQGLRAQRARLMTDGLIHGESLFPVSLTLMVAILLLVIGIAAIITMLIQAEPAG